MLSFSQTDRKVAVLDLSERNSESNSSRIWSAMHVVEIAGVPYDTTSNLNTALNYPVILFATRVQSSTFNSSEKQQIRDYVNAGGVAIISSLRDADLFDIAGVSAATSANDLYKLTWETGNHPELFYKINDTLETTISLGRPSSGPTFFTRYYQINDGEVLARYDNDSVASVYNEFGNGFCYVLGPDFREVIYRNQIDSDVGAHRTYSNGFEPTSDVICFWVRNIVRKHIPYNIHKYTIPGNASSVMLMTHDIDSRTAMDTMQLFSDYEVNESVPSQYNITTRYFNDALMSNFYVGTSALITEVINDGHTLASHSVGHFPDYADDNLFPFGTLGNTFSNYHPSHFGSASSDGTVLGELEVSKNLIELDHNVDIKSFRAGHLAYPDSLGAGLELTGYEFNSTHSANNILTSFPFYIPAKQSFTTTMTGVLEIPMTISDVFSSDPINSGNYGDKVNTWNTVTKKYDDNHSPITLLIHPNREYKLQAQMDYVDALPSNCLPYAFEEYGRFWRKRDSLKFRSELNIDTLNVYFENSSWTELQSFVIDDTGLSKVRFFDHLGMELSFNQQDWSDDQTLYYYGSPLVHTEEIFAEFNSEVYPNPTTGTFILNSDNNDFEYVIYNSIGTEIYSDRVSSNHVQINLNQYSSTRGLYLIVVKSKKGIQTHKLLLK